MLAIRMQRTGRSGHAQFRLIVQESRRSPKSGSIVAALGSYNPHSKEIIVDKEKASFYLTNGAQPSSRVAMLLQKEGVKMPSWVKLESKKEAIIRNPEKRRSTRPAEEVPEETTPPEPAVEAAESSETPVAEAVTSEADAEVPEEA